MWPGGIPDGLREGFSNRTGSLLFDIPGSYPTFRSLLCEIIFFMMRPKQSNNFPNRFIQIENFGDDSAFNPK